MQMDARRAQHTDKPNNPKPKLDSLLSVGDSFYMYGVHCTAIVVRIVSISSNGWYKLQVVEGSYGHCGKGVIAKKR